MFSLTPSKKTGTIYPAIERLERLQTERRALTARVANAEQESTDHRVMSNITEV
jgi:hypothetical protein